ncbi:type 2 periplasmic-binding domain-containing protein [Chachezhania sediminis]|uniref:hypothetical protein n=1 Tax=Chachezhania sediminis TaxID=2599291 RepID=UPI00131A6CEF|nr:hypothetical protein [Chachezhania sediminis]
MVLPQNLSCACRAPGLALVAVGDDAAASKFVANRTLTVAFTGDMPGSNWQDGRLIGYDSKVMQIATERISLTLAPALMEWSGPIASGKNFRAGVDRTAEYQLPQCDQ